MLIAALLELKSRLMLPREEEELLDVEPGEAAEELLARMLEARRYRARRRAPRRPPRATRRACASARRRCRRGCARVTLDDAERRLRPGAARLGDRRPAAPCRPRSTCATSRCRGSRVAERLAHLRALLRRGGASFDEAVRGADRVTVAVTLFALLELYKQGEATWDQDEPFGEIAIAPRRARGRRLPGGGRERARPDARGAAVPLARARRRRGAGRGARLPAEELDEALDELREALAPGAAA